MLTSFTVARYRSFVEPVEIELRPLTLLFGPNNAGKSALVQVLPLLADSILAPGGSPLKLGGSSRDGSFEDIVSRIEHGRGLSLGLTWDGGFTFSVEIRDLPELYRQVITEMRLSDGNHSVEAHWIPEEAPRRRLGNRYELLSSRQEVVRQARLDFEGIVPILDSTAGPEGDGRLFEQARSDLLRIAGGVQWLGSLRTLPGRRFRPGGSPPPKLGPDGQGFAEVLFYDKKIERSGLWDQVSSWFEEHFKLVLDVVVVAEDAYLALSPVASAALRIPLTDSGEGMAQVLPVLVALAMAQRSSRDSPRIVAFEQPELHLHPAAESALGQRLVEVAASEDGPTLLVETHSENLMLSVQLGIAGGSLPPDAVLGYWIERLEDGRSMARRIEFDEAGQTSGWPEGVFSEDIDLARQLFRLRQEQRKS